MKPSKFEKWFKAQFGRVPRGSNLTRLRQRVDDLETQIFIARCDLTEEERIHQQYDDALKGWNAGSHSAAGDQPQEKP